MSKPRPRPLLIGILIVGVMLVPALAGRGLPTYAEMLSAPPRDITDFDFTLDTGGTPDPFVISVSRFASGTGIAQFLLNNRQAVSGTIVVDIPNLPDGWTATFSPPPRYTFPASSTILYISLKLTVPANTPSTEKTLQVRATSLISQRPGRPLKSRVAPLTVKVVSGPPIAGTGCPDTPAPGADFDHARLLHVDTIERHGLCETGEQDWFKFGAVGGKYYTIEITQADDGLDLAIDVFDDHHNQLTSNDDFPFRPTPTPTGTPTPSPLPNTTPTATPAAPATIMPRIKSFRAPRDGLYYIRVRDAADVGGDNATYEIVVQSESYGAEPVQVPEICNDRYEPDGLPENARLLTANQTQEEHRLCPTGDADWVKFFGHSGMTYALFTNTKKYATTRRENDKDIIINTEPGADTVLSLFGTDGRTFWDTNDNAQGLPTTDNPVLGSKAELDSNILFTPPADGYYYAQVKNGGDVGDQQIRYDLTLTVCPGSLPKPSTPPLECNNDNQKVNHAPLAPPSASAGIAPDIAGFAFLGRWQKDDQDVAELHAKRSWMWGPKPLRQLGERYDQAPGGIRQVAYFDKGRMEVNNPAGDQRSDWFITSGRLVVELITGGIQTGDTTTDQRYPANIPIAGDLDDAYGPTYASFGGVTSLPATNRYGLYATEEITRSGRIVMAGGNPRPETRLEHFVGETGHYIPNVFWAYFETLKRLDKTFDWVYVLGYPLSEPYWAHVKIGRVDKYVLIQPFERRVLTYNPDNKDPVFRVEMGNVGRHYYEWRYGEPPPDQ